MPTDTQMLEAERRGLLTPAEQDGINRLRDLRGFPSALGLPGSSSSLPAQPSEPVNTKTSSVTTTTTTPTLGRAIGETLGAAAQRLGPAAAALTTPGELGHALPLTELLYPPSFLGGLVGEATARYKPQLGVAPEDARTLGQTIPALPTLARGFIGEAGSTLNALRSGLPAVQQQLANAAATTQSGQRVASNAATALTNLGRLAARPSAGRSVRAIADTRMLNLEAQAQQAIDEGTRTLGASSVAAPLRALTTPPPPPVTLFNPRGEAMIRRAPTPPPVTRRMIPPDVAAAEQSGAAASARAIHFWDRVSSRVNQLGDVGVAKALAQDQDLLAALMHGATPGEQRALQYAVEAGSPLGRLPYTALKVEPAAIAGRGLWGTMRNVMIATGIGGAVGGLPGAIALPLIGSALDATLASPLTGRLLAQAMRQAPGTAAFAQTASALVAGLVGPPADLPRTLGPQGQ